MCQRGRARLQVHPQYRGRTIGERDGSKAPTAFGAGCAHQRQRHARLLQLEAEPHAAALQSPRPASFCAASHGQSGRRSAWIGETKPCRASSFAALLRSLARAAPAPRAPPRHCACRHSSPCPPATAATRAVSCSRRAALVKHRRQPRAAACASTSPTALTASPASQRDARQLPGQRRGNAVALGAAGYALPRRSRSRTGHAVDRHRSRPPAAAVQRPRPAGPR
jgi:hypothetical protein